jgi:hypothetical protein
LDNPYSSDMPLKVLAGLTMALGLLLLGTSTSFAADSGGGDPPARCFRSNSSGELPTCTSDGSGGWVVTYPADPSTTGPGSGLAVLFVLVALAGIGFTVWKVSAARSMAREAGIDPDRATAMTMLTDDGFEATYLASSLRGLPTTPPPPADASERLRQLQELKDQGLVSSEEYDARRTAILDSI